MSLHTTLLTSTKKHLWVLLFFCSFSIRAQRITDPAFANILRVGYSNLIDVNNDLIQPNARNITFLNVAGQNIGSLAGLEGFTSLQYLYIDHNLLTSLPPLPSGLLSLRCDNNQFTALPNPLPNGLTELWCFGNPLSSLPPLPGSLTILRTDAGLISCSPNAGLSVSNAAGAIISLPLCPPVFCTPTIVASPTYTAPSITQCIGASARLTAIATGTTPMTVTWQRKRPSDATFTNILTQSYVSGSVATYNTPVLSTADNGAQFRASFIGNCSGAIAAATASVTIGTRQGANIPDLNFRNAIRRDCPACIDDCGNLSDEAATIIGLNVANLSLAYPIRDLTGIEGFLNLEVLNVSSNTISNFPRLPNSLKSLTITNSNLSTLPELPPTLETLICKNNNLTSLPAFPSSLMHLDCSSNKLGVLPAVLPNNLMVLDCSNNQLIGLPPSLPTSIKTLYCHKNKLVTLPTLPTSLTYFNCGNNLLSDLPPVMPPNLFVLVCSRNPTLFCLPTLPNTLRELYISSENIKCLRNEIAGLRIYDAMNEPIFGLRACDATTCVPFRSGSANGENIAAIKAKISTNPKVETNLKAFPNPVDKTVQVEFSVEESSAATISVSDLLGRQMLLQNVEATKGLNAVTVDMSTLPRGFYMLTLQNGKIKQTQRLVKQ
jgi:Leucine-rich repeat (LRR) protein